MNKNFVSIFVLFLSVIVMTTMAFAIVPPRVPGVQIPAEMLENLKINPNFYSPGTALSQKMQRIREANKHDQIQPPEIQRDSPRYVRKALTAGEAGYHAAWICTSIFQGKPMTNKTHVARRRE